MQLRLKQHLSYPSFYYSILLHESVLYYEIASNYTHAYCFTQHS